MHYLKCTTCGHLNEVKTEYLTFCSNCNKKLDNNFSNWKRANYDKTFEDFKNLICVTEQQIQASRPAEPKKAKGLKYWVSYGVPFIIAVAIFYAIGSWGGEKIVTLFRGSVLDKAIVEYANIINKQCPMMIDQMTRLDNTAAMPNKTFQYNYTVLSVIKDSVNIEKMKAFMEPQIINNAKTNPQMKVIRDNKITLNYSYKDKSGVFMFMIIIKPEQYLQ